MDVDYFATSFNIHQWTLANYTYAGCRWIGSDSDDWNDQDNWSCARVPLATDDVFIPDASTTVHSPTLTVNTSVQSVMIESGGILNGGTNSLTITGGSGPDIGTGCWTNLGTFNPGLSTVIFTNPFATMADPTNFHNVIIASGAALTLGTGNVMRIDGTFLNDGTLNAALLANTVEFNGTDQDIINPNGASSGYYNLILSGSGTKTMPVTPVSVSGNFSTAGNAHVTAASSMSIAGHLTIGSGSSF